MSTLNWSYVGTCLLPTDLPVGVQNEWKETLIAERARIKASLNAKISSESEFQDRIADASSDVYATFVSGVPAPWDKDVIAMKQRLKLARKWTDWSTGIENCFKEGGYFGTIVTAKADKLKLARYVLGVVGHRATVGGSFGVWNPATFGLLLLRGDTRPLRYKDGNDAITNQANIHSVFDPTLGKLVTPAILADAIYASVMMKFAMEPTPPLTAIKDAIKAKVNPEIDLLINVALNADHKKANYDVTYVLDWSDVASNVVITVTDLHPT